MYLPNSLWKQKNNWTFFNHKNTNNHIIYKYFFTTKLQLKLYKHWIGTLVFSDHQILKGFSALWPIATRPK